ncbi:MAG: hypothetical protein PHH30_00605 [Bacteroidales bacterium]|nr:hypothetical protein [Bacteroidales bacterium]
MKNIKTISIIIAAMIFLTAFSCNNNHSKSDIAKENTNDSIKSIVSNGDTVFTSKEMIIIDTFDTGEPMKIHFFNSQNIDSVYEKQYYMSGNLFIEGTLINNQRTGKWVAYYENGKIWSVGYFAKGLKNGSSNVYYDNGQIRYTKNYINDVAEGLWSFYDDKGNLLGEVMYEKGQILWQKGTTDE